MKSEEELRRRTGEAAKRFAEPAQAPSGTGPAPGDLYVRLMVQVPRNGAAERLKDALEALEGAYGEDLRAQLVL